MERIFKDTCRHNRTVDEECLDCYWNAAISAIGFGDKIRKLKK